MKSFHVYSDPGHAWGKVPERLIIDLEIEQKVSRYSYYRNGFVYLEEDCDLPLFYYEFERKHGQKPLLKWKHGDRSSRIRNYRSYTPDLIGHEDDQV